MQARHLRKSPSSQLETGHAAAPLRPPATDAPAHRQRSTIAIRQAPHILHQWMKERLFLTDGNGNGRRPASHRFLPSRSDERRVGTSGSVRVDLGGVGHIKKKNMYNLWTVYLAETI